MTTGIHKNWLLASIVRKHRGSPLYFTTMSSTPPSFCFQLSLHDSVSEPLTTSWQSFNIIQQHCDSLELGLEPGVSGNLVRLPVLENYCVESLFLCMPIASGCLSKKEVDRITELTVGWL